MIITWDEPKRLANIVTHGMDFTDLDEAFFEASVVGPAKLGRLIAVGRLANGVVAVVFVALGTEGVSVISEPQGKEADRWLGRRSSPVRALRKKTGTMCRARN
jgi:uncharacterized DUF497 family protein